MLGCWLSRIPCRRAGSGEPTVWWAWGKQEDSSRPLRVVGLTFFLRRLLPYIGPSGATPTLRGAAMSSAALSNGREIKLLRATPRGRCLLLPPMNRSLSYLTLPMAASAARCPSATLHFRRRWPARTRLLAGVQVAGVHLSYGTMSDPATRAPYSGGAPTFELASSVPAAPLTPGRSARGGTG